ncbi:MAG: peptidase MA family metallohydrolase [Enhygromyxa sp.]
MVERRPTTSFGPPIHRGLALVMGLVTALLLMFGAPRAALAEHGRLHRWDLADASQQLVVGRAMLRYEPGLESAAWELGEELPNWWSEIEQALGRDLDDRLTIHLVSHAGMVAKATGMPVWVSGVAHSPSGEIAISMHNPDGSRSNVETVLRHELVHVALHRATGGAELPRWFHEGVAESLANEVDFMRAEALAGAVFGRGVPALAHIEDEFRGDARQASVAYAAARDLATWLRYHDPDEAQFRQLLSQLRNGREFEQAVVDAYGVPLAELDSQWRAGLFGRFVWFPLLGSGSLPFLLVGPAVVFAWVRRRRRLAADWARLEAEDQAERAARLEQLGVVGAW